MQSNKPCPMQYYVPHLTTFCFRAAINLSTSSMEVLCSVESHNHSAFNNTDNKVGEEFFSDAAQLDL